MSAWGGLGPSPYPSVSGFACCAQVAAASVFGSAGDGAVVVVVAEVQVRCGGDGEVTAPAGDGLASGDGCGEFRTDALMVSAVASLLPRTSCRVVLAAAVVAHSAVGGGWDEGGAAGDAAHLHAGHPLHSAQAARSWLCSWCSRPSSEWWV